MTSTVVPGLLTFRLKPSLTFFGFFFVPALCGEAVTVSVRLSIVRVGDRRRRR